MKNYILPLLFITGFVNFSFSQTVTIGTQVWMTKNLNVATFRNGEPIPQAKTKEAWKKAGDNQQPAWCYYNYDPANGAKYGKLYNWYAVNDSRGLAPVGYHIPSDAEWSILKEYLGVQYYNGGMKSKSGWNSVQQTYNVFKSCNGTNTSGFSGLPGGRCYSDGFCAYIGRFGCWWSSTEDSTWSAWSRQIYNTSSDCSRDYYAKWNGFSVRCVKDPVLVFTALFSDSIAQTVTIGAQEWMTKNLDVATFRNGDPIPQARTYEAWKNASKNQQPAWCYFHDDPAEGVKYGKLYNWYAVNDARGIAPVGYHIPSDAEWTTLADSLGGAEYAGTKMKSTSGWKGYGCMRCDGKSTEFKKTCTACKGTSLLFLAHSTMPFSGNGSNSSGFTGLPGGGRSSSGSFENGDGGGWWSSSEDARHDAWARSLASLYSFLNRYDAWKGDGFSVRCVKD